MEFSEALLYAKDGCGIERPSWNGKGMWVYLTRAGEPYYGAFAPKDSDRSPQGSTPWNGTPPFLAIYLPGEYGPTSVPYCVPQTDLFADDWKLCPTSDGHIMKDKNWPHTPDLLELIENGYPAITLDFSYALFALKKGRRVCREGWNGKDQFLFVVPGSTFKVNRHPLLGIYPEGTEINYHSHIDMRTSNGIIVPWTASQSDLLGADWLLADNQG